MSKASIFNTFKNYIAKHYGNNPGKMLIHTGVIGWVLSSLAQVTAIVINDKIPKEQKMFLIPQEMADACVNIISFYLITQTTKSVASKLVNMGKWLPKSVKTFLVNHNLADKIGKQGFDVLANGNLTPEVEEKFSLFRNGIDFLATTVGSVLSCNIVTPIVRNMYASKRQKTGIAKMNATPVQKNANPEIKRPLISDFQTLAYTKYSNSGLKI